MNIDDRRENTSLLRGRGATFNPANRFEALHYEADSGSENPDRAITTQYFRDDSQSIIAYNDSPDVGFDASLNPYRGCEHGCAYCYARPSHEFLGFSAGVDFESRIMVKPDAPNLLRRALNARSWKPQAINLSGITDCYQPIEKKLGITRSCLGVLAEFRNPVYLITKNRLIVRDIDHLQELAKYQAVSVFLSVTTLDSKLATQLEPRASQPSARLDAVSRLRDAGIPIGVNVAPIIPGLTDHEIPQILHQVAQAGALFACYTIVRLPLAVAPIFSAWLETHFPSRKEKILNRIRSMRDGKLNNSDFGRRMRGGGLFAEQIDRLFEISCRREKLDRSPAELNSKAFRRIQSDQPELF